MESQLGKGTTFTVRLPYEKAEMPALTGEPVNGAICSDRAGPLRRMAGQFVSARGIFPDGGIAAKASDTNTFTRRTHRPLVLVADDEPDMRRFLVSQLEEEYEVVEAADGNEATEKAQAILPDVILLDLMMPHKDGLQVCRELREYAPTVAIPIILLTARADEEAKFDALADGRQ